MTRCWLALLLVSASLSAVLASERLGYSSLELQPSEESSLDIKSSEDSSLELEPSEDSSLEMEPSEDSSLDIKPSEDSSLEMEPSEEPERPPHEPTLATVAQGQLRGVPEQAVNGKEFYAFRGIPFAQPPVGERRFQPPEGPPPPWEGVREAADEPPHCPQMDAETLILAKPFHMVGQEDCLYLNAFSPMPDLAPADKLLPVMVFIHGGAYMFGYAGQYPPHTLMSQDIVLVVIQYRLGTLGFLSTEDDTAPGNMGILDQTLALKWVQQNVAAFGGNPLKITIFGESAGASSVHLQALSHTSLGYFHRAIVMSGSALSPWAMGSNHRDSAYFIAKILDCHTLAGDLEAKHCPEDDENPAHYNACLVEHMSSAKIMKCIRQAPVEILTESCLWFIRFQFFPMVMGPRVHKNLLMQHPALLIKEGRFKKMDMMMGTTRDDGAMITMAIYSNEGLRSALRFKFGSMGPLSLDMGEEDIAPLNQTIKIFDYYVGSNDFDLETADAVTAMYTDRLMWYPTDVATGFHAADPIFISKKKKIFAYEFSYRGQHSLVDLSPADIGENWVDHGDDLIYLFGAPRRDFSLGVPLEKEEDLAMRDKMVKMFTNFAATGNPTTSEDAFEWVPYTPSKPEVLVIDSQPKMMQIKDEKRQFWRQLPLKMNMILYPGSVANLTKIEPPAQEETVTEPSTHEETGSKKDEL